MEGREGGRKRNEREGKHANLSSAVISTPSNTVKVGRQNRT